MVKHILKSGQQVKTVKGHIIRKSDCPQIYKLVEKGGKKNDL